MISLPMEDPFGIVYVIENPQQFWSELEDILRLPRDVAPTLEFLDSTLQRFVALCAAYHHQYLHTPLQVEHACGLVLNSELFAFHSERMCENLVQDIKQTTDPHVILITYTILLFFGRRRPEFFRSHKRWVPLFPLIMDHALVEIDPDHEIEPGVHAHSGAPTVEGKLRTLAIMLLYEVCRLQKFEMKDLRVFDEAFIDHLFDLVEQTREMTDESFNYSVITLIVALNEQFMVAALPTHQAQPRIGVGHTEEYNNNRVLRVLMRRLGSSRTFSENMIFMLNRAQRTPEDLCMQLLILKLLYLLFTTRGTEEFFYTNDLCVLVDVFLRDLVDLDENSDSLRHTYLRVLHPLLTKTQLRSRPYKRAQIVNVLESLVGHERIRDISPTTKRLVERCLSGDWCIGLRARDIVASSSSSTSSAGADSQGGSHRNSVEDERVLGSDIATLSRERSVTSAGRSSRTLKNAKSMEFKKAKAASASNGPGLLGTSTSSGAGHGPRSAIVQPTPHKHHHYPSSEGTPTPTSASPVLTNSPPTYHHHRVGGSDVIISHSNLRRGSDSSIGGASLSGVALASTSGGVYTTSPTIPLATPSHTLTTISSAGEDIVPLSPTSNLRHHAPLQSKRKGSLGSVCTDNGVSYSHHHSITSHPMPAAQSATPGTGGVPRSPLANTSFAASSPDLLNASSSLSSGVDASAGAVGSKSGSTTPVGHRRLPPPIPTHGKRRKPPAVPIRTINVDK
jgi:hypothetical protein